jgi:NitT/TauT family transport system permease protein
VRGAVGALVLFAVLEVVTRAELLSSTLPPASTVLGETVELLSRGDFLTAALETLRAAVVGLGLAAAVAIPVGLLLGWGRTAYKGAIGVIELLRPIPSVALIPLGILLFGRDETKVPLVVYASLWPILFNTIYGIRSVDPVAVDTARAFGLGRWKVGTRVYLRAASPFIFTGVKIAASLAVILAVSSELIAGGTDGIGVWMLAAQANGDQTRAFAVTVVAGLIGLVVHLTLTAAERRLFAWHAESLRSSS